MFVVSGGAGVELVLSVEITLWDDVIELDDTTVSAVRVTTLQPAAGCPLNTI